MTIAQKLKRKLNDNFKVCLKDAVKAKFDIEIETGFNIFSMNLVTVRVDGNSFTPEQMEYLKAYEAGYLAAMNQVI